MTRRLFSPLPLFGRNREATAPSFLFLGDGQAAFEAIRPMLECLARGAQRMDCFLSTPDPALGRWLTERFPEFTTVSPPPQFGPFCAAYLRRLKVRTVILLEHESVLNLTYAANLQKRAIPLVLLSGRGMAHLRPATRSGYEPEILVAVDKPGAAPEGDDARRRLYPSDSGRMDAASAEQVLELLVPLAGRNLKWTNRGDRPLRRWVGQRLFDALDHAVPATVLRPYVQRYDTTDELRARLEEPDTILCLGNGPSSEDPRLNNIAYNALFRVNHSWLERGLFTNPDVVFTGGKSTMRAVKSAIFGLQGEVGEKALLMTRGPGMLRDPLRYFVMDRLGPALSSFDWGQHRPTNGSSMIAAAVDLNPRRLVIAGIDLFQHPDGSYPGDSTTANAYTPGHTVDKELAFMFVQLDQFAGEIIIIGDALNREWRAHTSA